MDPTGDTSWPLCTTQISNATKTGVGLATVGKADRSANGEKVNAQGLTQAQARTTLPRQRGQYLWMEKKAVRSVPQAHLCLLCCWEEQTRCHKCVRPHVIRK